MQLYILKCLLAKKKLIPRLDLQLSWDTDRAWHLVSEEQVRKEPEEKYLLIQVQILLFQVALWSFIIVEIFHWLFKCDLCGFWRIISQSWRCLQMVYWVCANWSSTLGMCQTGIWQDLSWNTVFSSHMVLAEWLHNPQWLVVSYSFWCKGWGGLWDRSSPGKLWCWIDSVILFSLVLCVLVWECKL